MYVEVCMLRSTSFSDSTEQRVSFRSSAPLSACSHDEHFLSPSSVFCLLVSAGATGHRD